MNKNTLHKIVSFLNKDITIMGRQVRLQQVISGMLAILIVIGLNKAGIIHSRNTISKKTSEEITQMYKNEEKKVFVEMKTSEKNKAIDTLAGIYDNNLNSKTREDDLKAYLETNKTNFKISTDYLKNTNNQDYLKDIMQELNQPTYIKSIYKNDKGYLIQPLENLDSLYNILSKYEYKVFNNIVYVGDAKIKDKILYITIQDLQTGEVIEKEINVDDMFGNIGYLVVFNDGTIEITSILENLIGISFGISNIRLVAKN